MRSYVAHVSSVTVQLDEAMAAYIQEDFVQARKADPTISQETLSTRILLAKWVDASHGHQQLTKAAFEHSAKLA
jgi:hypothetical protein